MQTRILPPDEWPRLAGTEAEALVPHLNPSHAAVLVVEREERIVGCWVALQTLHAECVWLSSELGNPAPVAKQLVEGMFDIARSSGLRSIYTSAMTDEVRKLIEKLGGSALPGTAHVIPVPEKE
jgi:N-acyl-L-homoserine lactone synthetase